MGEKDILYWEGGDETTIHPHLVEFLTNNEEMKTPETEAEEI